MFKRKAIVLALGAAALFSGCATPVQPPLTVEPFVVVRNGGAEAERLYRIGRQYQGQRRLGDAERSFLKALTLDANHAEAHNALGVVYFEQGLVRQTEQQFKLAIAAAPGRAHLHNNLGYLYQEINRFEDAVNAYSEALLVEPANQRALVGLAALTCRDNSVCTAPAPAAGLTQAVAPPAEAAPTVRLTSVAPNVWELQPASTTTAAAAASAPPAEPMPAPMAAMPMRRIEVSNGNGVTGLAKRVGLYLHAQGFWTPRLTNHRTFRQRHTEVQYVPGAEALARRVSGSIDSQVRLIPVARLESRVPVRLVLGKDFNESQSIANGGRPSGNQVALVSTPEQK